MKSFKRASFLKNRTSMDQPNLIKSQALWNVIFLLSIIAGIFSSACSMDKTETNMKKHPAIFTNIVILGDSRMYDAIKSNFCGFANYLTNYYSSVPELKKMHFISRDDDPNTYQLMLLSDHYTCIGNNATFALSNMPYILKHKFDALLISLGANCSSTPQSTTNYLAKILAEAKSNGLRTILMTVYPWKGYRDCLDSYQQGTLSINRWIMSKPINADIVVDAYSILEDPKKAGWMKKYYTGDGLHLMPAAHKAIAAKFVESISNFFQTE